MTAAEFTAIRKSLGLTQAQWAEWLGMHRVTIADIERGAAVVTPTVKRLVLLYAQEPRALRLTDDEYATLRAAAARTGEEWAAWARRVLIQAAKEK